ncbi:type II secretion system minor pseudopilin GspH [Pseudaeromonas paramecii]|uniref:Type II secretion system protein H n=1 Tax=Pseudaeromonas paramecii TaxID=2138166 RepID=A0ABP8QHH8_9GAMM
MPRRQTGFTLIEIMLVVVILGCAVGIAILSLPGMGSQGKVQDLRSESERLLATVQLAAEQSVLEGRTLGLRVDEHGYQFLIRRTKTSAEAQGAVSSAAPLDQGLDWNNLEWVPYEQGKFPAKRDYGDSLSLSLTVGGLQLETEESRLVSSDRDWGVLPEGQQADPQVLFLPGGEVTPFSLTLSSVEADADQTRQIRADELGQFTLLQGDEIEAADK